jgi:hypothetical protein
VGVIFVPRHCSSSLSEAYRAPICGAAITCTNPRARHRMSMYPQSSKAISAILIAVDADIQTLKARSVKKLALSSDSAQQALPKKPITVNVERRRNSQRLGNFSVPFVMPLSFGSVTSCKSETVRPAPVASSNVPLFGLFNAPCITDVTRRNRSKISSFLSWFSRGRGICDESWSRKYSKVRAIWSSAGSQPGRGDECIASLPKLTTPETR